MCVEGRHTKLDKTQGGLQRGSQDLTKGGGGGQYFINFYAIKIFTYRVFYGKRLKQPTFKNYMLYKGPLFRNCTQSD